jgi:ABC-2 type transport system ATP-binding protein
LYAIVANQLTKIYQTVSTSVKARVRGMKEQGPGLWIKNAFKLTNQKMREVVAVDSLSFSVERGEIFAIVGPNGAGKTSLIKMLSGLLYPTSGNAKVLGLDLIEDHERIKDKIAYVSTSGWMGLEWQLTVYENLLFYADLLRIPRKKAKRTISQVMEELEMNDYAQKTIPQLSAGMRQMLTIARGLIAERPIIYLDEPTTSLDTFARKRMWKLLLKRRKKQTVIFSSHDPQEIEYYADRIMMIKNGRALIISRPEVLLKEFVTEQIYQAELSNVKLSQLKDKVKAIDAFSLSDRSLKIRFSLEESLNDFLTFLISNGVIIHNITKSEPRISDAYVRIVNYPHLKANAF